MSAQPDAAWTASTVRGRRPVDRFQEMLNELGRLVVLPCRSVDPDLFFAESRTGVERAKAICQDCPMRPPCLLGALERREPWGVWGGEAFLDGRIVARRGRGRPRKDEAAASMRPVTDVA